MANKLNNIVEFFKKHMHLTRSIAFLLLFIAIWISYDILIPLTKVSTDALQTIRTAMIIVPIICLGVGCYLFGKKKLTIEKFAFLVLLAGFSMRIGYAFYTGGNCRQHDVEMYNSSGELATYENGGQGHFAYIAYIYMHGSLPTEIKWQFYHPPLWHACAALFMKIYSVIKGETDLANLFQACMILSSFVGCLTLYGFKKVIFEILHNDKARGVALLIIAFHSQFFIMSGWMNNESMALMFSIFSIYFALRYHKSKGWVDILACGAMIGCGMMSKISAALVCLPIAIILIVDLVEQIKNKKTGITILQFVAFLAVCAPLGLWFQIKNIVQYGISSITVPAISTSSSLSVVDYSFWQRFGLFNPLDFKYGVYCILRPNSSGYMDYNVWLYTIKCSVFGEYSYWGGQVYCYFLFAFNAIIMLYTLYCIVDVFIREGKNKCQSMNILMAIIFLESIVSYIFFQITNPVTCTQDFRYMTLILLPGVYFIGKEFKLNQEGNAKVREIIGSVIVVLFVSASFLTFVSVR